MVDKENRHLKNSKGNSSLKIIAAIVILISIISIIYFLKNRSKQTKPEKQTVTKSMPLTMGSENKKDVTENKGEKIINYNKLEKDKDLKEVMEARKKKYDIKNSLDMIVGANETFIIKSHKLSMAEILKQAALKRGDVIEENIGSNEEDSNVKQYGIYIVRPGDNIWNIHFNILKEYYNLKNISLDSKVDEPDKKGFSSGVGKILKFSETQVIIYNLETRSIDSNINIIEPLTKIIIYNMYETFSLLDEIDFENVDRLQFDGRTIWISTDTKN